MISKTPTDYYTSHPKIRDWTFNSPGNFNETVGFAGAGALIGAFAGFFAALLSDLLFLGGAGTDPSTEADGSQIVIVFMIFIALGVLGSLVVTQIGPRLYTPTYFTTEEHRRAHKQFHSLSPESQSHARDAYDALAAFSTRPPYYDDDIYPLFAQAESIWESTYKQLSRRELAGDTVMHRERLEAAKMSLDAIQNKDVHSS